MTNYLDSITFTVSGTLSVSRPPVSVSHPLSEKFSGIVVNQQSFPAEDNHCVHDITEWVFQEFLLPEDYPRGDIDQAIPPLTGLQVFANVAEGTRHAAGFDFRLEYLAPGLGWLGAVQGTEVGAAYASAEDNPMTGVWLSAYFEPLDVTQTWQNRWRFGIRGRDPKDPVLDRPVEYDGTKVTIGNQDINISPEISTGPLREGEYYPFVFDGVPSVLYVEPGTGQVLYSTQHGLVCIWYSSPNPLRLHGRAYGRDGVNPLREQGNDVSLLFRILGGVADGDDDFLGNSYRSLVVTNSPENLATNDNNNINKFWLSKPNPSRFAVESLYFDVRQDRKAVVIDQIYLDPLTTGVEVNVYFSNDERPGTDDKTWDNLIWERVPTTFKMARRDSYALPHPIGAKFIKLEFSHLQARYYAPGDFQAPIVYKKFPRWVSDYYFALYEKHYRPDQYASTTTSLTYDALDLAYNYYLDDLIQRPDDPKVVNSEDADNALLGYFGTLPPESEEVDLDTLSRIRQSFTPFLDTPMASGRFGFILAEYGQPVNALPADYSVESVTRPIRFEAETGNFDQDQMLIEKAYPVMSFYLPCRHRYRKAQAYFSRDRGYFAGVKEVAFIRNHYAPAFDHPLYIESAGDNINVERNDFETVNFTWANYV